MFDSKLNWTRNPKEFVTDIPHSPILYWKPKPRRPINPEKDQSPFSPANPGTLAGKYNNVADFISTLATVSIHPDIDSATRKQAEAYAVRSLSNPFGANIIEFT